MEIIYAMLKQTFPLTKHFLSCQQKWETWPDTCSKSEALPSLAPSSGFCHDGAHFSYTLLRRGKSHTFHFKWSLFQRYSEKNNFLPNQVFFFLMKNVGILVPWPGMELYWKYIVLITGLKGKSPDQFLTSRCLLWIIYPCSPQSLKNFLSSPVSLGPQCVGDRHQQALLTSCMESRSLVSW